MNDVICIYHKNCTDGFGAALAVSVWAFNEGKSVKFIPALYGNEPPDVEGKEVLIVDFSYRREVLLELNKSAKSLVVLDHHKTAQEALKGLEFCIFDMTKSGAVLTWEYLFKGIAVPELLLYIQDRDLWNWELEYSREVSAGIGLLERDFVVWSKYLDDSMIQTLITNGSSVLKYQNLHVKRVAKSEIEIVDIAGHKVPCVNATSLISEIGHAISKGYPFAAMYFETKSERVYSLRSADDGIDVSEIAKRFDGGGHYHAAGFTIPKPKVVLK